MFFQETVWFVFLVSTQSHFPFFYMSFLLHQSCESGTESCLLFHFPLVPTPIQYTHTHTHTHTLTFNLWNSAQFVLSSRGYKLSCGGPQETWVKSASKYLASPWENCEQGVILQLRYSLMLLSSFTKTDYSLKTFSIKYYFIPPSTRYCNWDQFSAFWASVIDAL